MAIHLRQICLVASELEPVVRDLEALLSINVCHVDPEVAHFGLENALLPVGSKFIEVVAPIQTGTAAGRFLERRGGDGGYMVICQVPDLEEQASVRARAAANKVRVAYEADRGSWNIMQLHPRDMGAAFLEVDWDQQADMTGNWQPAGGSGWKDKVSTEVVSDILAVELQSENPEALAARWAAVTGEPVVDDGGQILVRLANAELRFVAAATGTGDSLSALDLLVEDSTRLSEQARSRGLPMEGNQILIGGVRLNLVNRATT